MTFSPLPQLRNLLHYHNNNNNNVQPEPTPLELSQTMPSDPPPPVLPPTPDTHNHPPSTLPPLPPPSTFLHHSSYLPPQQQTPLPPMPVPTHSPLPPSIHPLPPLAPTSFAPQPPPQTNEMSNIDILAAAASALAVAESTPSSTHLSVTSSRASTSTNTPRVSVEIQRSALVQKKGRRRLAMRRRVWPRTRFTLSSNSDVEMEHGEKGVTVVDENGEIRKVVSEDVMIAEFKVRDEKDRRIRRRKPRVVWSEKLHARFVAAVEMLGVEQAVPRAVLQLMNVRNLTRENVASHLQKYRNSLKAEKGEGKGDTEKGEGRIGWRMQRFGIGKESDSQVS